MEKVTPNNVWPDSSFTELDRSARRWKHCTVHKRTQQSGVNKGPKAGVKGWSLPKPALPSRNCLPDLAMSPFRLPIYFCFYRFSLLPVQLLGLVHCGVGGARVLTERRRVQPWSTISDTLKPSQTWFLDRREWQSWLLMPQVEEGRCLIKSLKLQWSVRGNLFHWQREGWSHLLFLLKFDF